MLSKLCNSLWVVLGIQLLLSASVAYGIGDPHKFYFSPKGNDLGKGTRDDPWKTLGRFNKLSLKPGDEVLFEGGGRFEGTMRINQDKLGSKESHVRVGTYGKGPALILAGDSAGIVLYLAKYLDLEGLKVSGSGRKNGNTKDGVAVINCEAVRIYNFDISGFQKSGVLIYSSSSIQLSGVHSHDNGSAGITVEGNDGKKHSRDIRITQCIAVNNPGDPTNLNNHSGNGIVVGHCTNVKIDHCMATENGWDMPRIGNGPVGIWAYEADSVIIENCLSFRNKTSPGAADGGGFDLDGGVTNSIIQYCLSYENQGAGYCMFQYWGASPWYNNIIRFNISENDGTVSDAHGGAYVWNSSGDPDQLRDCVFYNNTIYNARDAALSYSEKSSRKHFSFFDNIFVGADSLIRGDKGSDQFLGNNWWSCKGGFKADGTTSFEPWTAKFGIEVQQGQKKGSSLDPQFLNPGHALIRTTDSLQYFENYRLPAGSLLRTNGIHYPPDPGGDTGQKDFFGIVSPAGLIGACAK